MTDNTVLISRRGVLKGNLTRTINSTKGNTEDIDIAVIKAKRDKCEELWREYNKVQSEIEEEMPNMSEEHESYRNEFEELYFQAVAECEKIINKSNNITIHWSTFYDMLMALVHTNDLLSPVQKFLYLRSSISGKAANVIKSLETTAKNYETAWATLTTRYSNKKVLAQAYKNALFDLETISSESPTKLRQLTDTIIAHMNALETLDQNPKLWGSLLIHLVTTKLDSNTLTEWEMAAPKTNVASIDLLITFLQKRCQILEAVESAMQINVRPQLYTPKKSNNNSQNKLRATSAYFSADDIKCFVCKQSDTIYKCPTLLDMSVPQRIQKVTDLNLCKNLSTNTLGQKISSSFRQLTLTRCTIVYRLLSRQRPPSCPVEDTKQPLDQGEESRQPVTEGIWSLTVFTPPCPTPSPAVGLRFTRINAVE
ncbi:hypothetical protein AGLY_017772 [Aphis glycines]|uniref:Uncharacterized protein n=1 Tax=Aphis glycines TaxID=307491 RepID=A0A6G0SW00_APHGL|nr:hypothetical protein AGLY_017772 [Aphis glycines]